MGSSCFRIKTWFSKEVPRAPSVPLVLQLRPHLPPLHGASQGGVPTPLAICTCRSWGLTSLIPHISAEPHRPHHSAKARYLATCSQRAPPSVLTLSQLVIVHVSITCVPLLDPLASPFLALALIRPGTVSVFTIVPSATCMVPGTTCLPNTCLLSKQGD